MIELPMQPEEGLEYQKETPEARAVRFKAEELQRLLVEHNVSGDAADLLIEELARKHKAEAELNAVFSAEEFHEYESVGSFGTSESSPEEDDVEATTAPASEQEAETQPAVVHTAPPTPEIENVSADTVAGDASNEGEVAQEDMRGQMIAGFNMKKERILDLEQRAKDAATSKEDRVQVLREMEALYSQMGEITDALFGRELLDGATKADNFEAWAKYKKFIPSDLRGVERKNAEREAAKDPEAKAAIDAYYAARDRRKNFVETLTKEHGDKKSAELLYDHATRQGSEAERILNILESGDAEILKKPFARHTLDWYVIDRNDPEHAKAQLAAIVAEYRKAPPVVEQKEEPKKEEEVLPAPVVEVAPEKIAHDPEYFMNASWETLDAHMKGEDPVAKEAARLEWEKREHNALEYGRQKKEAAALENVLQAIKSGYGETVPEEWLRKFHEVPEVARYLSDHPLAAPVPPIAVTPPAPSVRQPGLSNKQIADDLDANDPKRFGKNVETTAETSFEIKEGKAHNKAADFTATNYNKIESAQAVPEEEGKVLNQTEVPVSEKIAAEETSPEQPTPSPGEDLKKLSAEKKSMAAKALLEGAVGKDSVLGVLRDYGLTGCEVVAEHAGMLGFTPADWRVVAQEMFAQGGSWQFVKLLDGVVGEKIFDASIAEQMITHGDSSYVKQHIKKFDLEGLDPETRAKLEGNEGAVEAKQEFTPAPLPAPWSFVALKQNNTSNHVPHKPAPARPMSAYDAALEEQTRHIIAPEGMTLVPMEGVAPRILSAYDAALEEQTKHIVAPEGMALQPMEGVQREESQPEASADSEQIPDAEVSSTEAAPQEAKERTPINHGVVKQFEEKFGIDEASLEKIPGFGELSSGQQLLALKNLESLVLSDVKEGAVVAQQEEWAATGFLKKAFKSIMTFGMETELRIVEIEKELLAKQRGGDAASDPVRAKILAKNIASLEALVNVAAAGPDVEVKEGGVLNIKYVSPKEMFGSIDDKRLTAENLKAVERFNDIADQYAKYPHEWGYETAKPGFLERFGQDRRAYNKVKSEYDAARAGMMAVYQEKFAERGDADPEQSALLAMNQVDERMQLNQLFNTHPDAEAALHKIEDQMVIASAAKEFWKKKGMFVAYGAAARAATVALSGGAMLPVIGLVGGGVGYGIGQAEAQRLMKTRRADGRMSEEDEREEITYGVYKKDAAGNVLFDEATGEPTLERTETRRIKEYTDANFFVDRIDRLCNKLEQTEVPAERELLEQKIAQTVALMKEKNARGMINFGGSSLEAGDARKGSTIANRLSFIQAMAKGEIDTSVDRDALAAEMERITGLRQETIEDERKSEMRKIATKSSLIRGAFALGGAFIVEGIKDLLGGPGAVAPRPVMAPKAEEMAEQPIIPPRVATETVPAEQSLPSGESPVREAVVVPKAPPHVEVAGLYTTKPGEGDLASIIKEHIAEMKNLTPAQQEIAIVNLSQRLTPEQMREIGITDLKNIPAGTIIRIDKINDLLGSEKLMNINGESLINNAARMGGGAPTPAAPASIPGAPSVAEGTGAPVREFVVPKAPPRPSVAEVAPVPMTPEAALKSVLEVQNFVGHRLTPDEASTLGALLRLESQAQSDPGLSMDLADAKVELLDALKGSNGPLSSTQMYRILEAHHLEGKVIVPPDNELMQYLSSRQPR